MKLDFPYEEEKQEFKTSLAELDKGLLSLSAMLNKHGEGEIYYGVSNSGEVVGLSGQIGQETIKKISARIGELIKPAFVASVLPQMLEGKTYVLVTGKGNRRPYSCGGEYRIRVGSEDKKIDPDLLADLFFASQNNSLESIASINQNLTFSKLKFMYLDKGLTIQEDTFEENMGLKVNGKYNMLANLLADENDVSIKVVRFSGKDKTNMLSRNEYGYTCLLSAMEKAKDYVLSLNETRVDIVSALERKETKLFDTHSFEEAWTNACLHNKWVRNVPPAIYIFDDRIEIISTGGLPFDYSKEDFYRGVSRPINLGLLKIMGQLRLVEQTGHGNLIIVGAYGREAFDIEENYIVVTIPFAFVPSMKQIDVEGLSPSHRKVLLALKDNPAYSKAQLASFCDLGTTRVSQILSDLKAMGKIERIGATKGGYWKIL
ncbi:MAG: putative DNA binding domain-containing protein [Bacilli bacterium]|nr:putative DNA binding domain-containing protein [Bacilli bacterium]MBO6284751.1 putative DNA binding domain-containing protein [Bacilli bacterium]